MCTRAQSGVKKLVEESFLQEYSELWAKYCSSSELLDDYVHLHPRICWSAKFRKQKLGRFEMYKLAMMKWHNNVFLFLQVAAQLSSCTRSLHYGLEIPRSRLHKSAVSSTSWFSNESK